MVAYEREIETFFLKSTQLLEAFPNARLTTKYRKVSDTQSFITAKTYDAASGVVVKFKTNKTVDLGRLMVGSTKISAKFVGKTLEDVSKNNVVADAEMADVPGTTEKTKLNEADISPNGNVATEEPKATTSSKKKKKKGKK